MVCSYFVKMSTAREDSQRIARALVAVSVCFLFIVQRVKGVVHPFFMDGRPFFMQFLLLYM